VGLPPPTSRFMGALGPKPLIGVGGRPELNSLRGSSAHIDGVLPASSPQANLTHPDT
jgi:hypothetical protein